MATSTEAVATTTIVIAYQNSTSVTTELVTSTITTIVPMLSETPSSTSSSVTCTPTSLVSAEQQAEDSRALDFLFTHNNVVSMLSSFPMSEFSSYTTLTGDVLPPIKTALENWVPCTATPYNVTTRLVDCKNAKGTAGFAACIIQRTSPYVHRWANTDYPPTSAIAALYNQVRAITVGADGVSVSADMNLIEGADHVGPGDRWGVQRFRNMMYYFEEYNSLM